MATVSVDLPLPIGTGPGPAVDTSALGKSKTIVIGGGDYPGRSILIEASVDGGVIWAPVYTFHDSEGRKQVEIVAQFMRVVVKGGSITGVNVDVGAPESETLYAVLPLPAGDGPGPSVDVTALGLFKTAIVGGSTYKGPTVFVEVSQDGVDFAQFWSFPAGDGQSANVAAKFMRARVTGGGVGGVTCSVGADQFSGGADCEACLSDEAPITVRGPTNAPGAGDKSSRFDHDHRLEVEVEDEGVLAGARPRLNFIGAGVTAVDNPGADKVDITIPAGGPQGPPGPQGPQGPPGPTGESGVLLFGDGDVGGNTDTKYLTPGGGSSTSAAQGAAYEMAAPRAGTLRSLVARHNRAVGGPGTTVTYTVEVNGVASALLVAGLATNAIGQASDLVNSVAVAQLDRIRVKVVRASNVGTGNVNAVISMEIA